MTKRLTPEEDAKAIEGLEQNRRRHGARHFAEFDDFEDGDTIVQIDKSQRKFEIVAEGERFLEVRFKRREPADAGKVASTVEQARQAYMDREQNKQARKINFAGPAQQRYFESLSRVDPEQFRIHIEGNWNLDG